MVRRIQNHSLRQLLLSRSAKMRSNLQDISYETGQDMKNWLDVAVRDWTHKPSFSAQVTILAGYTEVKVEPKGSNKKIFTYVDQGTGLYGPNKRPYVIAPKNPDGFLKFQSGYSAKTAPVAKLGQGTGERYGDWVQKKEVIHPGIKARKFSDKVIEELMPDWKARVNEAIGKAMKGK